MKLKRAIDVVVATALLVVTSPVMAVCTLAILTTLGRPVLFRQRRPGLGSRPFTLVKFRTMTDARGPDGELLPDAERLTRLGRFLRATSLDELPELWNVLRGDMSLVGPRPLLERYLRYYTDREMRRHDVLPGITGLAQVRGRNLLDWDSRLELDVQYVENWSLKLDLEILIRTLTVVVTRSGLETAPASRMLDLDQARGSSGE